MILLCRKCGAKFDSLIVDRSVALREVFDSLTKHAMKMHRQEIMALREEVGKATLALIWFATMTEFAVVPESESYIAEEVEKVQDAIMRTIGFDPEEEEDEEDEGEDVPEVGVVELPEVEHEESDKENINETN